MENTQWEALDPQRSQLRALVLSVNQEVSNLMAARTAGSTSMDPLLKSWDDLVRALALGPEPDLRACPSCSRSIMSTATRCRYCFSKSPPLPASGQDVA